MIDERLEDAYKKEIEQLKCERDKLIEETEALKAKSSYFSNRYQQIDAEAEKLRAQMEIVHLIFGGVNR